VVPQPVSPSEETSSVVWLLAQFVGPFSSGFPAHIPPDGVRLTGAAIRFVLGWLAPSFQAPSFEAPGSSSEMTMEQIVQGNCEKQEQQ
jgi:hypothetical protein